MFYQILLSGKRCQTTKTGGTAWNKEGIRKGEEINEGQRSTSQVGVSKLSGVYHLWEGRGSNLEETSGWYWGMWGKDRRRKRSCCKTYFFSNGNNTGNSVLAKYLILVVFMTLCCCFNSMIKLS